MNRPIFQTVLGLAVASRLLWAAPLAAQTEDDPFGSTPAPPALATAPEKLDAELPAASLLREFNIAPDAQGIGDFLRSLHSNEETQIIVGRLIAELGDDEYAVRNGAMKRLMSMPMASSDQLEKAGGGVDPEVRWRIKEILAKSAKNRAILPAVLQTVSHQQVRGLAKELLATIPLCHDGRLIHAADYALQATVTAADADLLRQATKKANVEIRVAATAALGSALGEQSAADMKTLVADPSAEVRLIAARTLAKLGDRAALEPLGQLLEADDLQVRLDAVNALRGLTGQKFVYLAYDEPSARRAQTQRWQTWIAENGATAALLHPLNERNAALGRTLICDASHQRVIEFGPDGKLTWQYNALEQPWACQGLPNGHRLVASNSLGTVIEFDESGKNIWRADVPIHPASIERLENGHLLISGSSMPRVFEIDRRGKRVDDLVIGGRPMDARRLSNGLTLVAMQEGNRVAEFSTTGKERWSLTKLSGPVSAQRLENNLTLVAELGKGRVVEFDRAGQEVWSQGDFPGIQYAQRLENGNTLVAFSQGVREIDRHGRIVWEKLGLSANHVSRY